MSQKKKEPTQEELFATGTILCACSYIARNRKTYNSFQKEVVERCSRSAIKQFMSDTKDFFLDFKFAQVRSAAHCLKTLEVYAAFRTMSTPKNSKNSDVSIIEDALSKFLWKHRPRYVTEIMKLKGRYPESDVFFTQQTSTPTIEELSENISCYRLMLIKYGSEHPDAPSLYDYDADYLKATDNFIILAANAHAGSIQRSGRISTVERYFRNIILGDHALPVLERYFDYDNARLLMGIEAEFCNGSILSYKFTEKDANVLARNISDILKSFLSFDKLHQDRDDPPTLEEFMQAQKEPFDDFDRLMDEAGKVDLNYIRLLYAYSRVVKNERDELASMYIDHLPEEAGESVSKEEASRLQREIDEKEALLQKKQDELNRMQIELDREKKKSAEWKEKYHAASGNLQEMQKLIETISDKNTHVDSIESDEKYEFPSNTVLFGGHPNWQRKFKLLYPDVKVYTADELGFSPDVIRNADLLLLNVTHMSHKQYYRVIQEVRRHHKKIEYIN